MDMKFVYFDVGGVLIKDLTEIDDGWGILLSSLGLRNNQRQEFDVFFEKLVRKFDLGEGIKEFALGLKVNFGIKLPDHYSISDDLVNRFFYKKKEIWKIVDEFKKRYGVGLLTNMYGEMLDLIIKKGLIPNTDWAVIVDSSIEKCRKPDKKIYEIAQKRAGVEAKEILFIDNKLENLEIPKELGWQTYWYDSSDYEKSNWKLAEILR
jgi:HAD superfamily hydrolase (TIGR01549 family)